MIQLFQHGAGEPPGYLLELFREKDLEYGIVPLYKTGMVPEFIDGTHLVFLGGQMSVNDEIEYPWIIIEKQLIREAVISGIPVLGICLGAQLIASALGKKVYPCKAEKGWCEIRKNVPSGLGSVRNNLTVFQWHNESFDLPDASELVYRGDCVENQMFTIGSATGVQFHPEVTEKIIHDWCLPEGRQEREHIISQTSRYIRGSNEVCRSIVTGFLEGHAI
jgi:GMP synthase-like glutamine amidotransferase